MRPAVAGWLLARLVADGLLRRRAVRYAAVLPGPERRSLVLADIPGLLEGAHDGVGLGQAFLRHIERCRLLLHIVDGSSRDPLYDFKAIQNELEMFSPDLARKPQVVCVNKMDLPEARAKWPALKEELKKLAKHGRVDRISAATNTNLMPILVKVRTMIDKVGGGEACVPPLVGQVAHAG